MLLVEAILNVIMYFLCLGDFGSGDNNQVRVAQCIRKLSQQYPIEFILGLGDNIYPDGVKNVKDPQFQTKFEIPYSILKRNLMFFQTLGNHDYRGNITSQIKYTDYSERWKMPNNFYVFQKRINGVSVEFFAIDTNLEEMSVSMRKKQERWLIESLNRSRAKWRIVFGHHPWKSSGTHGNSSGILDEFYKKIINTGKIHVIFSGHDHDQQHIHIPNLPHLFISGVGSHSRHNPSFIRKYNIPNLYFFSENLGCCLVKVSPKILQFYFINYLGQVEYTYKLHHKTKN